MRNFAFRIIYYIFAAITLIATIATLVASFSSPQTPVFNTGVNILIFGSLIITLLAGIFIYKPKFSIYKVSFYILHAGLIIALAGMFTYAAVGDNFTASLPLDGSDDYQGYSEIIVGMNEDYSDVVKKQLGFIMRVKPDSFEIDVYEDTGSPRQYSAVIQFLEKSEGGDLGIPNTDLDTPISVNNPIRAEKYKIYLMSYNTDEAGNPAELLLMFKKDPAEFVSVAGIILTIIGTFGMCIISPMGSSIKSRFRRNRDETEQAEKIFGFANNNVGDNNNAVNNNNNTDNSNKSNKKTTLSIEKKEKEGGIK